MVIAANASRIPQRKAHRDNRAEIVKACGIGQVS